MEVAGKVVVVTGGGRGIGAAMCRRFSAEGAERVYVTDCDEAAARTIADEIPRATGLRCDVSVESDVKCVVSQVMAECGRIEIFCSNAGITVAGGLETENADWQKLWDVNVMSRLYAARAVVPSMLEAGAGYLVHVASAAGLLTEIGSAGYSVTKHADVAMAEWLSVCYGRQGIRVSCVCPLGVKTDMINDEDPIHR
ncbi:MAG: SDR family oxidoreductase, partial [Planctomycetaceae bacterium]|nr:SDR family oxidoreductase [Planctomycetaceae bacterium]